MSNLSKIVGFRNNVDGEWKSEDTPKINSKNGYDYLLVIIEGSFINNVWTPESSHAVTPPAPEVLKQLKPGVMMPTPK